MYQLQAGDLLGPYPYVIERPLGNEQGNMSETYLATIPKAFRRQVARGINVRRQQHDAPQQVQLPRRVIVKIAAGGRKESNNQGISNEQVILPRLDHPHIVRILNVWHSDGGELGHRVRADLSGEPWFCVFEYISGGSMADWLAHYPRGLPVRRVVQIAGELVTTINYLHQQRFVHMDIKPANILFRQRAWITRTPKETVLIDFGIARRFGQSSQIGTWDYMSPERRAALADKKSIRAHPSMDIFALGLIIYEMLTGRNPIASSTLQRPLPVAIDASRFRDTHNARQLYALVQQAVDHDPNNRPTAEQIVFS